MPVRKPIGPGSAGRGFTLIEVLVVIAILITLGVLVMVGVGKATKAAHKTKSLNNIKQLSTITVAEASDNNGEFPDIHGGNLPFLFDRVWRETAGITKEMAYAPSNKCWNQNGRDVCSSPKRDLWEYGDGENPTSIFSYVCLVHGEEWMAAGEFQLPDDWEVIKDRVTGEEEDDIRWVPQRLSQEVVFPILWIDLHTKWGGSTIGNFVDGSGEPEGVHIGYLDGHIEWVSGKKMKARLQGPAAIYW